MATPELAILALIFAGFTLSTADPPDPGKRVESESYTAPPEIARCITYNISKKLPHLKVRHRSDDTSDDRILLVLTQTDMSPSTYGVIRVEPVETGSRLTTWLSAKNLASAPGEIAQKLIAGC
jgi:hypothetical protein